MKYVNTLFFIKKYTLFIVGKTANIFTIGISY